MTPDCFYISFLGDGAFVKTKKKLGKFRVKGEINHGGLHRVWATSRAQRSVWTSHFEKDPDTSESELHREAPV